MIDFFQKEAPMKEASPRCRRCKCKRCPISLGHHSQREEALSKLIEDNSGMYLSKTGWLTMHPYIHSREIQKVMKSPTNSMMVESVVEGK